ncbi:hypothetical protein VTI74DRAFT_11643 [Chaetomium olivicolor]
MGNNQSTEAPRRTSQKLSKPKTGNHATAGLLGHGSFSNSSRRLSNAPLPIPPAPSPMVTSTPTTSSAVDGSGGVDRRVESFTSLQSTPGLQNESRRRSLFRSTSTRGAADSVRRHHSVGPESRMATRPARASSMTYESALAYYGPAAPDNQPGRLEPRTSWNYNMGSYEAKRLLNLAEEPGLDHDRAISENMMTMVTETTWKSSNPAYPPSAPITRANSDVSLYMPVRRRSIIQTPGVATRSVSERDLAALPRPSFRLSHPPTPSLSRQHSVESYRSGIISMPPRIQDPDSVPRVVTPCEDKYLSIGAFKLGSLRITNGSPSPLTPEAGRSREGKESSGVVSAQDGYFPGLQIRESSDTTAAASRGPVPPPKFLSDIRESPPRSPTRPTPPSPALQTAPEHTALEDNFFEDEAQPEYSSVEILDVRLDPNAKPPHPQPEHDADRSITRTDSGFVSTTSPFSEASHKALSKADSGYSSSVSLRSFQAKAQVAESQELSALLQKQVARSSSHQDSFAETEAYRAGPTESRYSVSFESEPPPPPVPPKDSARNSPAGFSRSNNITRRSVSTHTGAGGHGTNTSKTVRQMKSPTVSIPSGDKALRSPEAAQRSPGSAKSSTTGHSSSIPSSGSGSHKHGRLQRLLGGTRRPAVTMHAAPVIPTAHNVQQGSVPPVPQEAEQKLRERPVRFPTAARRLGLKPRASLDTLKTIFSVGSMEASLDAVNTMQSVPTVSESERKEVSWKQTLNSVPASLANVAAHVIPRKPITRKPVPVRQESMKESGSEADDGRENGANKIGPASPVGVNALTRSPRSKGRAMSLTFLSEHRASDMDLGGPSATSLPFPPLPSPVAKALSAESSTSGSRASSATTRPQSLRVPPPLRPRSSVASLSRKPGRESMHIYPATHTLANKSSMDSLYSHSSSRPGTANGSLHSRSPSRVTMDPRRLSSFRQYQNYQESSYISSVSKTQTDHDRTFQAFPAAGRRRSSISSTQSEGFYNSHGWQGRMPQRPLRHRASYDDYSHQQRFLQYGHPPSMSNGYTAPVKPGHGPQNGPYLDAAAAWSRSQVDAAAGQWYQSPQQVPYVPRGHYRNRSMGNPTEHGVNPPYRVLHSYNSPAYRNAPIWG